jgi:hypothetical protein
MEALRRIQVGTSASMRACLNKARAVIEDTETDPDSGGEFRALARDEGIRAVHSTPLISRDGEVLGALTAYLRSRADPRSARSASPTSARARRRCSSSVPAPRSWSASAIAASSRCWKLRGAVSHLVAGARRGGPDFRLPVPLREHRRGAGHAHRCE